MLYMYMYYEVMYWYMYSSISKGPVRGKWKERRRGMSERRGREDGGEGGVAL